MKHKYFTCSADFCLYSGICLKKLFWLLSFSQSKHCNCYGTKRALSITEHGLFKYYYLRYETDIFSIRTLKDEHEIGYV